MKDFKGKVAVVTGGANGIGLGIVERCIQEGMHVVIADVEQQKLDEVANRLIAQGASVLAVKTDVSKAEAVEALAQQTLEKFGAVHLLFNNAGVSSGNITTGTLQDWEWVLGVNLWGVIHGVRTFTPIMLKQDTEAHIINTASITGLMSGEFGIYAISKHAIVALSETLYHELRAMNAKVNVSVLCPSAVQTKLHESERNRPQGLENDETTSAYESIKQSMTQTITRFVQSGISPERVANKVFQAIEKDKFYILTHGRSAKFVILQRMLDILWRGNPTSTA